MVIPSYDQILGTDRVSGLVIRSPYADRELTNTDSPVESGLFESAVVSGTLRVGLNGSGTLSGVIADGPNQRIIVNDGQNDRVEIGRLG